MAFSHLDAFKGIGTHWNGVDGIGTECKVAEGIGMAFTGKGDDR
jgi:hypothetical protein